MQPGPVGAVPAELSFRIPPEAEFHDSSDPVESWLGGNQDMWHLGTGGQGHRAGSVSLCLCPASLTLEPAPLELFLCLFLPSFGAAQPGEKKIKYKGEKNIFLPGKLVQDLPWFPLGMILQEFKPGLNSALPLPSCIQPRFSCLVDAPPSQIPAQLQGFFFFAAPSSSKSQEIPPVLLCWGAPTSPHQI